MALCLPVLVMLFGAMVDLGRAYIYQAIVTQAARDGARVVASSSGGVGPGTAAGCSAVQAATTDLGSAQTCPTTSTTPSAGAVLIGISCPDTGSACVGPSGNKPITVDVYYGFAPLTPIVGAFATNGVLKLHGQAVVDSTW